MRLFADHDDWMLVLRRAALALKADGEIHRVVHAWGRLEADLSVSGFWIHRENVAVGGIWIRRIK